MGSIVIHKKADKSGRPVTQFRAHIRRKGFASKSKLFPTRGEAKTWLRNNEAEATLAKAGSGKTLKVLINDFANLGNCAYARMSQLDYWVEHLGGMRVRQLTHADINSAVLTLRTKKAMRSVPGGAKATDKQISPATVNRYLATLSKVLSFAQEQGVIDDHPMKGGKVRKLKESGGRTRILTEAEEQRLYAAAKASTWGSMYLMLRMVLTTGARRSEVLTVKWDQIRPEESIAVIGKTKNGRPRALPLVSDVREMLSDASKVRPADAEYVFFNPKDTGRVKNIDDLWRQCRAAAGLLNDREDPLDRVVLHTTRHTAVTKMLRGGANLAQAAAVSGHQTLAMLKRYEHLAAADSVSLAEKLLGGKAGS